MKNILTGRIDHLNFKDGKMIHSTRAIRAMCREREREYVVRLSSCYGTLFFSKIKMDDPNHSK
jgi:hypothetical protein